MKKEERNQKEKMTRKLSIDAIFYGVLSVLVFGCWFYCVLVHIIDDGEFGGVGLGWVMFSNRQPLILFWWTLCRGLVGSTSRKIVFCNLSYYARKKIVACDEGAMWRIRKEETTTQEKS